MRAFVRGGKKKRRKEKQREREGSARNVPEADVPTPARGSARSSCAREARSSAQSGLCSYRGESSCRDAAHHCCSRADFEIVQCAARATHCYSAQRIYSTQYIYTTVEGVLQLGFAELAAREREMTAR